MSKKVVSSSEENKNDFKNPKEIEYKSKFAPLVFLLSIAGFILCFVDVYNAGYQDLIKKDLIYTGGDVGMFPYVYFILTLGLYASNKHGWNIVLNLFFVGWTINGDLFYNYGGYFYRNGEILFWMYPYIIITYSLLILSIIGAVEYNRWRQKHS